MNNVPQFILDALAKKKPVYLLNDSNRKTQGDNKRYHFDGAIYDYSIDKTDSEIGTSRTACNRKFLDIEANTKLVAMRRYADETIDAVEFIFKETKVWQCPTHGPIGELIGDVTNIIHYKNKRECSSDWPELFNVNGGFKRANIIECKQ